MINSKHKQEVEDRGYIYIDSPTKEEIGNYNCIKIQCPYCKIIYIVKRTNFINKKNNCSHCCNKYENSIAYYIEQELGLNLEKTIDIESCEKHPKYINKRSNGYIYIWWKDKYKKHSYKVRCDGFTNTKNPKPKRSFADWCIENLGEDWQEKYWSDKNVDDPWEITYGSGKKYWFKCQEKDYHEDYLCSLAHFVRGNRCPYCDGTDKVHINDSLGGKYPYYIPYWSKNNDKSIFEITPQSNKKYKWICENCGDEFERISQSIVLNNCGSFCATCQSSKGEYIIKQWLDKNHIEYIPQKKFDDLIGVNNGKLSYDFYLPSFNLLIEFQGVQHKKFTKGFYKSNKDFEKQLEHDRRKREYAERNNIELLEIWYYDEDNIENILKDFVKNS